MNKFKRRKITKFNHIGLDSRAMYVDHFLISRTHTKEETIDKVSIVTVSPMRTSWIFPTQFAGKYHEM